MAAWTKSFPLSVGSAKTDEAEGPFFWAGAYGMAARTASDTDWQDASRVESWSKMPPCPQNFDVSIGAVKPRRLRTEVTFGSSGRTATVLSA
ncbi:MAG: hypothetical protein ABSC94_30945 [Polyangiaceae bacterium]|jgi:hypothetical protein